MIYEIRNLRPKKISFYMGESGRKLVSVERGLFLPTDGSDKNCLKRQNPQPIIRYFYNTQSRQEGQNDINVEKFRQMARVVVHHSTLKGFQFTFTKSGFFPDARGWNLSIEKLCGLLCNETLRQFRSICLYNHAKLC